MNLKQLCKNYGYDHKAAEEAASWFLETPIYNAMLLRKMVIRGLLSYSDSRASEEIVLLPKQLNEIGHIENLAQTLEDMDLNYLGY